MTQIKAVSAHDDKDEADREEKHFVQRHLYGEIDLVKVLRGEIDIPEKQTPRKQPGKPWPPKPKRETRHLVVAIYHHVSHETPNGRLK